jgi:excisionase family DNA binding protein
MSPLAYKVRTVAELLETTPTQVYRLIESGRLRTIKIGPQGIRIPREALDEYMAAGGRRR